MMAPLILQIKSQEKLPQLVAGVDYNFKRGEKP